MPGGAESVRSGAELVRAVADLGRSLGPAVREQVKVGRRLWGAKRYIDVVLTQSETRRTLGLECKFRGTPGSAEEKIPATIEDLRAWPIARLVVFDGEGFSPNMRQFLISTGKAVELEDLCDWLELYFGLHRPEGNPQRELPFDAGGTG
jgi:hypothetical protein